MEQDQGTYQCRAENRDDSVDATATLEIHGMHIVGPIDFRYFGVLHAINVHFNGVAMIYEYLCLRI
jgi:hypothetical protein